MNNTTKNCQIVLGPNTIEQLPDLLAKAGHKVLLVHGHRPVEDGLLAKTRLILNKAGFPHANLGQILPNPKYESVKRGIEVARKENCDIILSLGGGSTLQCAKGIALGLYYKGDVWDFWTGKKKPKKTGVVASVLTNPSSGAELSSGCTIVRKGKQREIHLPQLVCDFAVLDPTLSMYPFYPTMNQVFGIFEDLFFAYLENEGEKRQLACDLMKRLFQSASGLENNIRDIPSRTELYQVGLDMRQKVGGAKIGFADLADRLSFACSLPEGSAGSALFPAWCDLQDDAKKELIAQTGKELFGLENPTYDQTMDHFIDVFTEMQMPMSIPETGLIFDKGQLKQIAQNKSEKKLLKAAMISPDQTPYDSKAR